MLTQLFWDLVVLAGNITAFWGWLKHQSVLCVIIGAVISVVDTLIRWKDLNTNARKMDLTVFLIGLAVGLIIKDFPAPYICGMLAINAYSLLIQAFSLLVRAAAVIAALPVSTRSIKEWIMKQKPLLVFLSILLAIVLVVKLLDTEYARGRASGIEYAKEELVTAAYESGYDDGQEAALDEHLGDYDKGYDAGYENAVEDSKSAYLSSLEQVYDEAYQEGYASGYEDGSGKAATPIYSSGYNENDIYRRAYEDAADQIRHEYENEVADAYEQGYEEGYSDGKDGIIY